MEHDDDDETPAADEEPEPWDGVERRAEVRAGRWPVYARNASGHPAPDLGRLPRHRWRQALAETELSARMSAANSAGERFHEAFALLGRVPHSELAAMAEAVGLRPTQLARQLIVRGVRAAGAP